MSLLGKKNRFLWLKVTNQINLFFFNRSLVGIINELFKSNKSWCASPTMYIKFKSENRLAVACLEKIQNFVG